jgi:hypothetical protein
MNIRSQGRKRPLNANRFNGLRQFSAGRSVASSLSTQVLIRIRGAVPVLHPIRRFARSPNGKPRSKQRKPPAGRLYPRGIYRTLWICYFMARSRRVDRRFAPTKNCQGMNTDESHENVSRSFVRGPWIAPCAQPVLPRNLGTQPAADGGLPVLAISTRQQGTGPRTRDAFAAPPPTRSAETEWIVAISSARLEC